MSAAHPAWGPPGRSHRGRPGLGPWQSSGTTAAARRKRRTWQPTPSPARPHRWRRFAGRLPNGELEVVQGGGHMPWYDDLGRVGAPVARFLGS